MAIGSRPLDVGTQTSVRDLQDFIGKSGVDDRIRGRKLEDGSIQLYVKPNAGGKFGLLSQLASYKSRSLAREGIAQIFENHAQKSGQAMSSSVRRAIDPGFAKDVKIGALTVVAQAAGKAKLADAQERLKGISLAGAGVQPSAVNARAGTAAKALSAGGDAAAIAKSLGTALGQSLMDTAPNAATRDDFAMTTGKAFKEELKTALQASGFEPGEEFLDTTFQAASRTVANNRLGDDGTLTLGGQTYRKDGHLGAGGGGTVDAYVNVNDPTDRIAFKVALQQSPESDLQMLVEVDSHARAEGGGHANVIHSSGGVSLPDGHLGIAMEIGGLGDMNEALDYIEQAAANGSISPEAAFAAKATLVQDAMKGMAHIQGNDLAHRDLKPENIFLSSDGTAKIADFGWTVGTERYDWDNNDGQSGTYVAPEVGSLNKIKAQTTQALEKMDAKALTKQQKAIASNDQDSAPAFLSAPKHSGQSPMRAAAEAMLLRQMPNLSAGDRKALLDGYADSAKQEVLSSHLDAAKRDDYAMGVTAFRALYGATPMQGEGFTWRLFDAMRANPDIRLTADYAPKDSNLARPLTADMTARTGLLADLADRMATPAPSERLSIEDAVGHAVFQTPDVGDASRSVIKTAIEDGRARKAAAKLAAAAPPATPPVAPPPTPDTTATVTAGGLMSDLHEQMASARAVITV